MALMALLLAWIGKNYRRSYPGRLMEIGLEALASFRQRPFHAASPGTRPVSRPLAQIRAQIFTSGVEAIPLVAFLALIIGSATITQAATVMPKIGAGDYFGNVMVVVVFREIGPLFTAFLVAGRTGSALSTALGNMKVQQEIDALNAMGVDPVRFLVLPSFAGTVTSLFGLTVLFNTVAIIGGFAVVHLLGLLLSGASGTLPLSLFLERILASMGLMDVLLCLVKPVVFGSLISLIACMHGMKVPLDIRAVPKATTRAVVDSFVLIVLFDALFALPFLAQLEIL